MSSNLIAHNPKFDAKIATRAQLAQLPPPVQLGRWHAPVPHIELVETILGEADKRSMRIVREKYALGGHGHAIFGVLDFEESSSERCVSLGFRNSTDQSLSLQAVAGSHVFVCDNLALSGDFQTWARKNTSGVNLAALVRDGFDRFAAQSVQFEAHVRRLEATPVADYSAKTLMWDVFADGVLPARMLPEAHKNYFEPEEAWTDCAPRTLWGLHNALTRVARNVTPTRILDVTTDIGKRFGIG